MGRESRSSGPTSPRHPAVAAPTEHGTVGLVVAAGEPIDLVGAIATIGQVGGQIGGQVAVATENPSSRPGRGPAERLRRVLAAVVAA